MCGRYNVIDSPGVRELMDLLGLKLYPETRYNIAPGDSAQIVFQFGDERYLDEAIWSLLIEPRPDGQGYRPSPKYSTFNARSGSLGTSPLWKTRFRSQRAIIPASGFHEWVGEQGHKQVYNIRAAEGAIAFAGLYEIWEFEGERVAAFTIITLPSHPRFSHIHHTSIPLMLQPEDFDLWLDPYLTNTDPLQHLLSTRIPQALVVEPVKSTNDLEPVGLGEQLYPDGSTG